MIRNFSNDPFVDSDRQALPMAVITGRYNLDIVEMSDLVSVLFAKLGLNGHESVAVHFIRGTVKQAACA